MKKSLKIFIIIFISIIGLIAIFNLALNRLRENSQLKDLKEIGDRMYSYKLEYYSERGFGNDREDVYSFSLKDPGAIKDFKEVNEFFEKRYKNLTDLIKRENPDHHILDDLKEFRQNNDFYYMDLDLMSEEKLYFYSPKANKGYLIIFTI